MSDEFRWDQSWDGVNELGTGSGSLEGYVYDEDGRAIEGVMVLVGRVGGAITDSSGRFVVDSIPAGRHVLVLETVSTPADQTHEIVVAADHRDTRCFVMRPVFTGLEVLQATAGPMVPRWPSPKALAEPVECLPVPEDLKEAIAAGLVGPAAYSLGTMAAVVSGAHPSGFFVAGVVHGDGRQALVGLWGTSMLSAGAYLEAVDPATSEVWRDDRARQFKYFRPADPGASESKSCVS